MDKKIRIEGVTFQAKNYTIGPVFDEPFLSGVGVVLINSSVDDTAIVNLVLENGGEQKLPVWAIRASFPRVIQINTTDTTVGNTDIVIAH